MLEIQDYTTVGPSTAGPSTVSELFAFALLVAAVAYAVEVEICNDEAVVDHRIVAGGIADCASADHMVAAAAAIAECVALVLIAASDTAIVESAAWVGI